MFRIQEREQREGPGRIAIACRDPTYCAIPEKQKATIEPGVVKVTGTFYVGEDKDDGVVLSLYAMDTESIGNGRAAELASTSGNSPTKPRGSWGPESEDLPRVVGAPAP